jgi:hypothetical protein
MERSGTDVSGRNVARLCYKVPTTLACNQLDISCPEATAAGFVAEVDQ